MQSFYGGLTGQSFKFSAIFPNRMALRNDLETTIYSPIGLNEFVLINYGLQNINTEKQNVNFPLLDYEGNRQIDLDNYENRTFNGTLWQKIYKENLEEDKDKGIYWYYNNPYLIADLEGPLGEETNLNFCYICIGNLAGMTPLIETLYKTIAPAETPSIKINNDQIDNPKLTFYLPEAVEIFWDIEIENEEDGKPVLVEGIPQPRNNIEYPDTIKAGDYIVSKYDYIYLYNKEENETPILEYKGTFIPTFKQVNNNLNAFNDNGNPNQITIELKHNSHNDYTFETKVPQIPIVSAEVENIKPNGTETTPVMAVPTVNIDKNKNEMVFNFGIPEAISIKHSWSGTALTVTSASGTDTVDLRGPQGLQGIQGEAGATKVKYHKQIYASIEGVNNYKEDILAIITPDIYPLALDETAMVTYIVDDNYYAGYLVINPDGQDIYAVVPLDQGSGGSNTWEELE